jgi:hypothetical protein
VTQQRKGRAESQARSSAYTDERPSERQPIPLNFTPWRAAGPLEPLCLAAIAGLLAVAFPRGALTGLTLSVPAPSRPSSDAPMAVVRSFPANGALFTTGRPDPAGFVPVTIQTSAPKTGGLYVATLRDWMTNRIRRRDLPQGQFSDDGAPPG